MVVNSTWDMIYNPKMTLKKLKMAAAKENGAKSIGVERACIMYYLHEYVHDISVDALDDLREEMMNLIVKFRGASHRLAIGRLNRSLPRARDYVGKRWARSAQRARRSSPACVVYQATPRQVDELHVRPRTSP